MAIGLATALPCILLPLLLQPGPDRRRPWHQRFWVKANLWIAIFSFIGNYFWTHYFYELLGASYTFPSWSLNNASATALHCPGGLSATASRLTLSRFAVGAHSAIFHDACILLFLPCCI